MDLDLTPTKSAEETELDTPPRTHTPSTKNRHPPPPVEAAAAAFKECMKNHAANIGGHAVDGCGEYMPPPPPSAAAANPTSLICAACGCHRNFHRRDPESPTAAITPPFLDFRRPGYTHTAQPNRTLERHQEPATPAAENLLGRKRSRTKFSQEQKERMYSFSEKLGWKMLKSDEAAVAEFCRDAGVARGVLKVWMHNNKNTLGAGARKLESGGIAEKSGGGNGESRKSDDNGNGDRCRNGSGGGLRFHDSNNGSSSSA